MLQFPTDAAPVSLKTIPTIFVGEGLKFVYMLKTKFLLETRFLSEKIDMKKVRFLMFEISAKKRLFIHRQSLICVFRVLMANFF